MLLAIDPGSEQSGWAFFNGEDLVSAGVNENIAFVQGRPLATTVAIEFPAYGSPRAAAHLFEVCFWIGRFVQRWNPPKVIRVDRAKVKLHLCGSARAKDSNIRAAIIERYGGKWTAIGTKKKPGVLYGVKSHAWQAIAVGLTVLDGN